MTLERDGYVIKEEETYRLGLRLLDLGGFARRYHRIYEIAKEEVASLAEETGEMANLVVEEKGKGVYLHRAHGLEAVRTDSYIGQRVHLHNTALGKAILAHLPETRVDEIIERHGMPSSTPSTITERDALFEELETVREEGVAFDDRRVSRDSGALRSRSSTTTTGSKGRSVSRVLPVGSKTRRSPRNPRETQERG